MQGYTDKYTPMVGEGHITILPWHYSGITQGTWVWLAESPSIMYCEFYNSSAAQNDQIDYKVYLDIGTYTAVFYVLSSTNRGILTLLFDSVSQGTVDTYNAGMVWNNLLSISSIAVTTAGLKTVSIKVATKSSGDYRIGLHAISLYRTA